uniref:Uncharacterized protein n=1 Tax=Octopus bimaculoides TaxID=37653 RepID=A0A0L8G2I3_OCTBM
MKEIKPFRCIFHTCRRNNDQQVCFHLTFQIIYVPIYICFLFLSINFGTYFVCFDKFETAYR